MDEKKKILRELVSRLLEEGNSIRIPADGYSMFPAIHPGDAIMISPVVDPGTLKRGEIIAWKREHDLVVHRIISIKSHDKRMVFITRGDSSMSSDQPIIPEILAGRVTVIEKKGKKLVPEIKSDIPSWKYRLNFLRVRIIIITRKLFR